MKSAALLLFARATAMCAQETKAATTKVTPLIDKTRAGNT
jgi:hypothetical protein